MLYLATFVLGRAKGGLHEMLTVERSIKEEDKAAFGGNESVKKYHYWNTTILLHFKLHNIIIPHNV